MSANLIRFENLQQVLKLIEPSFNQLAKIHNAVDYRREASFAIQALNDNEFLAATAMKNQDSLKRAVINVAAIGLSLNPVTKLAYLIPRKGKICLDISYKGLVALAADDGSIKWAVAQLVRQKDEFEFLGVGKEPRHKFEPFGEDRGPVIGVYCVAKTNQDEFIVDLMSIAEVHKIRGRSESYKSGKNSPWFTDEDEMIKKTSIRRASKSWPSVPSRERLRTAVEITNEEVMQLPQLDNSKRSERFELIRSCLLLLNYTEEYYLSYLCKATRRKITLLDDLTDIEIEQALAYLNQLVDEIPQSP